MNSNSGAEPGLLDALAVLGKTAGVLMLVVGLILLLAYLFNRLGLQRGSAGQGRLRVIASLALGQRERVVVVQVEDIWLVLGVGNGQVRKLHELPAGAPDGPGPAADSFASRFGAALRQSGSR